LLFHLAEAPNDLRAAVSDLSDSQLDTPYRPGGWSVQQFVHHLADAQMKLVSPTKLALTEDEHVVPRYDAVSSSEKFII